MPKQEYKRPPSKPYEYEYSKISYKTFAWLQDKYEFNLSRDYATHYLREVSNPQRPGLILPMRNHAGEEKGMIVKPLSPSWTGPKSLTYKHDPEYSGMSWFLEPRDVSSEHVLVVEDCLSAIALKQASGCATVSLNGTLLNEQRIDELLQFKWKIVLMLDADATRKAIQYAQKYGPDIIRVVRLQKDIKNMTVEEVESLLDREEL